MPKPVNLVSILRGQILTIVVSLCSLHEQESNFKLKRVARMAFAKIQLRPFLLIMSQKFCSLTDSMFNLFKRVP